MLHCIDCQYCVQGPDGHIQLTCNPFSNIKEPECLAKWQLVKLETMVQAYQATIAIYRKLAPMQEKMFRHMQREIDDLDEADSWKQADLDETDDKDEQEDPPCS